METFDLWQEVESIKKPADTFIFLLTNKNFDQDRRLII